LWIGGVPERHGVECGVRRERASGGRREGGDGRGREAREKHAHD
jgi:hypothetical protein